MQGTARATLATLLLATGLASGLVLGIGLAAPQAVVACSCVAPVSLAEYAGEETVIFSGTVAADDGNGVLFTVDTWFSGQGAAPVILVEGDFGDGASCGIGMRPAVGSSWLVVGWRPPAEGPIPELTGAPVSISICQPFVDLATPEGQALLDEAGTTFGGGEPAPSAVADGSGGPSTETLVAAGIGATLLAGVSVLAVALLVARRRGLPS
jgi:hypothetical protein